MCKPTATQMHAFLPFTPVAVIQQQGLGQGSFKKFFQAVIGATVPVGPWQCWMCQSCDNSAFWKTGSNLPDVTCIPLGADM